MSRFGLAVLTATLTVSMTAVATAPISAQAAPPRVDRPAPRAAEPSDLIYTVRSGDFLFGIAVRLKVTLTDLLEVNELTVTSSIHPGDSLVVPKGGLLPLDKPAEKPATPGGGSTTAPQPAASPAPGPATAGSSSYIVQNGDYLYRIASRNGVTFNALIAANNLTPMSTIMPGATLVLPPATLPIPTPAPAAPAPVATPAITPAPAPAALAATPAIAPAPAAVGPATAQYVVKNGDYLMGIATANGVTLKALLAANSMTVSSAIFPGTALVLPPATLPIPQPAAAAAPAVAAPSGAPSAQQTSIATVLTWLQGELGKPYLFNSDGPDAYDCSGLVVAAFRQIGISLPHQSLLQSQKGTSVDWRAVDVQAGDLIFYVGSGKTYISHVGIAISSTQWIQSARTGDVVKVSSIPNDDKIAAVRRIVN